MRLIPKQSNGTHTPGPLTHRFEKVMSWRNMSPSYQIVGPSQSGATNRTVYGGAFKEEDARLWAAAPDLLEALRGLVRGLSSSDVHLTFELQALMGEADAAIAKATEGK